MLKGVVIFIFIKRQTVLCTVQRGTNATSVFFRVGLIQQISPCLADHSAAESDFLVSQTMAAARSDDSAGDSVWRSDCYGAALDCLHIVLIFL